jgi:hypothetical protein
MLDREQIENWDQEPECPQFLAHYRLVDFRGQWLMSLEEARLKAFNDSARIWFVRHGDNDTEGATESAWEVESWKGRFVNCLGFFVTTDPCRPGDEDKIFPY